MSPGDWTVQIDASAPAGVGTETFVLDRDGVRSTVRLHDYDAVFAVPGLYEHVVQDRLGCTSPQTLAAALARCVRDAGVSSADVRCLDVGAGNGVSGAALHEHGLVPAVGLDVSAVAAAAADRDRPGLYARYVVRPLADADVASLVDAHRLTALVSAGALTGGHIEPAVLAATWAAFGPADWLAFTCVEEHADDARDAFGDTARVLLDERFVHRRLTSGDPVHYRVLVARHA